MLKRVFWSLIASLVVVIVILALIKRQAEIRVDSQTKHFANVVIFGDSLSDSASHGQGVGNNYWVKPSGITDKIGAPITSALSANDPTRNTWFNYFLADLSTNAGDKFYNIKDLKPNMAFDHNVSFATASAETGDYYLTDTTWARDTSEQCLYGVGDYGSYNCVPGVLKQLQFYLTNVNDKPNSKTLFILWAGGNDFYQNIVRIASNNGQAIAHPIDNMVKAVKILMQNGVPAENIYVLNLPNFSMVPALTHLVDDHIHSYLLRQSMLAVISSISQMYNLSLQTNLVLQTLGKFPANHVFPIDQLFLDVYFNKADVLTTIGITEPVDMTCAKARDLPYCHGYLFYNGMHPTTTVHRYLARQLIHYIQRT
ncbi:SGNH/GDSL hydrolase family protein [Cysteiniphilum halobium]|uniref:SGNH/GDSL hydrolase family protein n=1 Tax=Cysteiniphilum halobium TaxID=2219059 RepID=UPI000E6510F1|nr:SGNH/GDSL hydrolase family protein [Cysteiniphilum halobium]